MKHGISIQNRVSGRYYLIRDPQNRCGEETWQIIQQGDGTGEGDGWDTICLGLFWTKENAERFLNTFHTHKDSWEQP